MPRANMLKPARLTLPPKLEVPLPVPPKDEAAEAVFAQSFSATQSYGMRGRFERWRLEELGPRQGFDVYRKMRADDAVQASLTMGAAGILSRDWRLEVDDGDEQREEIARVLTYLLKCKLQGSIGGLIKTLCITSKVYGFAPVEKLYGPKTYEGKTYWMLRAYKLREPQSFSVVNDQYGNVQGYIQRTDDGRELPIDPRRMLWYVHQPEQDADYGRSALVAAYIHWWSKKNILPMRNIYIERVAGGFISVQTKEGDVTKLRSKDGISMTKEQKAALDNLVLNSQTSMGVVLPPGYELVMEVPGDTQAFDNAEMSCNKGIARALLQPNLLGFAEQGDYGSRGQSSTQFDAWSLLLDMECNDIANLFNESVIPELVEWNWGSDVEPPKFCFDPLSAEKRKEIAAAWSDAVQKGSVRNTYQDELKTRSLFGYPEREEDEAPAEATDPLSEKNPDSMNHPSNAPQPDPLAAGKPAARRQTSNPLSTARRGARTAYNALSINERAQQIERELFGQLGKQWEDVATQAARMAWESLIAQMKQHLVPTQDIKPFIPSDVRNQLTIGMRNVMELAWSKATRDAARELRTPNLALREDQVLEWLNDNADRFVTDLFDDRMIKVLTQVLANGIASGADISMIIEEAERALKPVLGERAGEGWATATPAQIATAVRTTLTTIYNHGRKAFFEDPRNRGFVQAYRFSAVIDDRTTDVCREMDDKVWPVDDPRWKSHTPPLHFNCRSLLFPITIDDDWEESGPLPKGVQPAPGFGT